MGAVKAPEREALERASRITHHVSRLTDERGSF